MADKEKQKEKPPTAPEPPTVPPPPKQKEKTREDRRKELLSLDPHIARLVDAARDLVKHEAKLADGGAQPATISERVAAAQAFKAKKLAARRKA